MSIGMFAQVRTEDYARPVIKQNEELFIIESTRNGISADNEISQASMRMTTFVDSRLLRANELVLMEYASYR